MRNGSARSGPEARESCEMLVAEYKQAQMAPQAAVSEWRNTYNAYLTITLRRPDTASAAFWVEQLMQ